MSPRQKSSMSRAMMLGMVIASALIALVTLAAGLIAGLAVSRGKQAGLLAERDALRAERDELRAERATLDERRQRTEIELARASATLEQERAAATEREAHEQRLRETFTTLSADVLRNNTESLTTLAEARLKHAAADVKGELMKRQQAIENLITPVSETLGQVRQHMHNSDKELSGNFQRLRQQMDSMERISSQLRTETSQLVTALRSPQQRGRWGEMQLRRIVEAAGMVEHCDFDEQVSTDSDDGRLRPDLVVRLAGGKSIVVDSKVSFIGFLEAIEATDEATRNARLSAHARHMKKHIDDLADKAYWRQFDPTPEFVVCFVPAEVFLNAALEREPALLEYSFERNVVIATPQTLIATLRTVAYTWRQEALAKNAQEVHRLARDLYARLATMGGHVDAVGKALNTAVAKYNSAVGSLEGRVLVTARKLTELQVVEDGLDTPRQVETLARTVQAPVLVSGDSIVPMPTGGSPDRGNKPVSQAELEFSPHHSGDAGSRDQETPDSANARRIARG